MRVVAFGSPDTLLPLSFYSMPLKPKDREDGDWVRGLKEMAPYLGLGTSFAASILLGLGVGYWLDLKLKTAPCFFLVGGVLGLLVGFYGFYSLVRNRKP